MSKTEEQANLAATATIPALATEPEAVELDTPIKRGEQEIRAVQLRKPKAGELRGIALNDLAQMDVSALQRLLPRITIPPLTQAEVDNLELPDLVALGVKVGSFLLRKADLASLGK